MFWIIAIAIALLSALLIGLPLVRGREAEAVPQAHDAEVYRDQLSEIERDARTGLIEADAAAQARAEIARRLIAADRAGRQSAPTAGKSVPLAVAAFICLLLPAGAAALYLRTGQPQIPDFPLQARFASPQPDANILIRRVELRLEQQPQDGRGWEVLAPVYMKNGRVADSINAWRNAIRYLGPNAERFGALAEALVVNNKGRLDAEAREAFGNVLALTPGDPRARFYLALADAQDGKVDQAIEKLVALKRDSDPAAPWIGVTDDQIARLRAEQEQVAKAPGNPDASDIEAAANLSDTDRMQMIRTMVESLDARLKDDPDNIEGWKRLIRSYVMLEQPDAARDALTRALAAFPADSDNGKVLIGLAGQFGISQEGDSQ